MSLDPITNRQKAIDAAADVETPALNPEFPYGRREFDPFFFGLDAEPPKPDSSSAGSSDTAG